MKCKCFSICGSHGVGKTTIINKFKVAYPNYIYIDEATRTVMPELGFKNPYDFVDQYGIAYYEAVIMSQWSALPLITEKANSPIILDRSPVDNFAYYKMLRKDNEKKYEVILERLCRMYCKYIDVYLFIPTGVFELVPDSMQVKETQQELECIIKELFAYFQLEYQVITSKSAVERFNEIKKIVEEKHYGKD